MSKKIVITFHGRGSQSARMRADLANARNSVAMHGRFIPAARSGKVLVDLIKRVDKSLAALPVFDPASLDTAMESINA